jgi:hypothetical protein
MAAFFVLMWRLHCVPVHFTGAPTSRHTRIAWIVQYTAGGVLTIVVGVWLVTSGEYPTTFAAYTTTDLVTSCCMGAVTVFIGVVCLVFGWISIVELRRAVHLRRQQLRQQTNE